MKNMTMAKSVGIGLAVGTAAAYASTKMMSRSGMKACKKNVAKCVKSMENMMDGIASMTR
ncbi:MAG: hypothetical protein IKK63_04725 [Clostridia bacterium]|nr:hypothetical protein [Clostridia bacterium]MBR3817522.1 hypothetical protein [Clostridia bacterium]